MKTLKRVVVIGGGTGQSIILRALKNIPNLDLSAIVTVADDGGSTGRLRRAYHIPAMGDIRSVMIALAEDESLFSTLMQHRFEADALAQLSDEPNELLGHNLGNIILTALTQHTGSFMEAISTISKVLNVKGNIYPSTYQVVRLIARMADGTLVQGESNIPKSRNRIEEIFYDVSVEASREAWRAITQADVIIYGIGSMYTSICPNLIIPELQRALQKSQALKIYCANAMTQAGETDGFSLEDHVAAIEKHAQSGVDVVLYANDALPLDVLARYAEKDAQKVVLNRRTHPYRLMKRKLLTIDQGRIRHDVKRLRKALESLIKEVR
jgi:uncharacterized cofD-like protein